MNVICNAIMILEVELYIGPQQSEQMMFLSEIFIHKIKYATAWLIPPLLCGLCILVQWSMRKALCLIITYALALAVAVLYTETPTLRILPYF